MHGSGHLASWVVEAPRPFKACLGLLVLEACMVLGHLVSWLVEARRPFKACSCLDVLEACMVGGILPHGWSRLADLSSHDWVSLCSRHAWLEAYCLMGGRRPLKPCSCLEVLEACMVGGILSHGWSRLAGLSVNVGVSRFSRHTWLEAYCFMGGRVSQASQAM